MPANTSSPLNTKSIITLALFCLTANAYGQRSAALADSVRMAFAIPGLSYAVITADSVLEIYATGESKINSGRKLTLGNRFRIGSNTKAVTGYIAAQLVKDGKLAWDTKFFDLFPELKAGSNKAFHDLTLLQLVSLRTRLFPYTYTYKKPVKSLFTGDQQQQRYQFTKWFMQQPPVHSGREMNFSNLGYVAAGLMMEKATGRSYQQLVDELGRTLQISFFFGAPNHSDTMQTWGHNSTLTPEAPADEYKLNWLQAAGNLTLTLPDYCRFIQLQLSGLQGRSKKLSANESEFLMFGLPRFSIGWFSDTTTAGEQYAWNIGNPGTYLSKVCVLRKQKVAIIVLANAQTEKVEEGMNYFADRLMERKNRNP